MQDHAIQGLIELIEGLYSDEYAYNIQKYYGAYNVTVARKNALYFHLLDIMVISNYREPGILYLKVSRHNNKKAWVEETTPENLQSSMLDLFRKFDLLD